MAAAYEVHRSSRGRCLASRKDNIHQHDRSGRGPGRFGPSSTTLCRRRQHSGVAEEDAQALIISHVNILVYTDIGHNIACYRASGGDHSSDENGPFGHISDRAISLYQENLGGSCEEISKRPISTSWGDTSLHSSADLIGPTKIEFRLGLVHGRVSWTSMPSCSFGHAVQKYKMLPAALHDRKRHLRKVPAF